MPRSSHPCHLLSPSLPCLTAWTAGDLVHLYRDLLSNAIFVDVQRGPSSQAAAASAALAAAVAGTAAQQNTAVAHAPAAAAELLPAVTIDPYVAAAAAAATAGVLPCQVGAAVCREGS